MKRVNLLTFVLLPIIILFAIPINGAIIKTAVTSVSSQFSGPVNIAKPGSEDVKTDIAKDTLAKLGIFYNRKKIANIVGKSRKVLLTFDDGPNPRVTPKILEILRKRHLKAIFFVLGLQVKKYPQIVKQIHSEGHIIGNHSYNHKDFTKLTREQIDRQINQTNKLIESITGEKVVFLRPPYGALNRTVINLVVEKGMNIMLWDVDPKDWKNKNKFETLHNLQNQLRIGRRGERGGVVLMHDIYSSTAQALSPFLDKLAENNYAITSIYEFSHNNYNMWAAKTPYLFQQQYSRQFELQNTNNDLLVLTLKRNNPKKQISALTLLKAKRAGNLIAFMFKQKL